MDKFIHDAYVSMTERTIRRLIDGITYERLAEEFDLSTQQIKNIVYKCENLLFKKMKIN